MAYDDYDMAVAARKALYAGFGSRLSIMSEGIEFEEPGDGSMWLQFDYLPASKTYASLDRKCIIYLGMAQVKIVFSPGKGVDKARLLAKEIAEFFNDGKILGVDEEGREVTIYEGASSHPFLKGDDGWQLPIRFTVRYKNH